MCRPKNKEMSLLSLHRHIPKWDPFPVITPPSFN